MFIGHYSIAFALKKYDKKLNLGFLFIAAQLVDFAFCFFVIFGIEHARIVPGFVEASDLDLYNVPISHSLLGVLFWAIATCLIFRFGFRRTSSKLQAEKSQTSLLMGIAVFSHYVLDFLVHTPDLLIVPGIDFKIGLGLWRSLFIGTALEISVLLIGCFFYFKSTTSDDNFLSKYGMHLFIIFLVCLAIIAPFTPNPPDIITFSITFLVYLTLLSLIAFWLDKKRIPVDVDNS